MHEVCFIITKMTDEAGLKYKVLLGVRGRLAKRVAFYSGALRFTHSETMGCE